MDGNHHANRYHKNTDAYDTSLAEGLAYIPRKSEYEEYLKLTSNDKEVSHLMYSQYVNLTIS